MGWVVLCRGKEGGRGGRERERGERERKEEEEGGGVEKHSGMNRIESN
jgi:hypothetical protein